MDRSTETAEASSRNSNSKREGQTKPGKKPTRTNKKKKEKKATSAEHQAVHENTEQQKENGQQQRALKDWMTSRKIRGQSHTSKVKRRKDMDDKRQTTKKK